MYKNYVRKQNMTLKKKYAAGEFLKTIFVKVAKIIRNVK